ncbi:MAG: hypothetical protein ABL900_06420 [Burkholderiaceae bacterium]
MSFRFKPIPTLFVSAISAILVVACANETEVRVPLSVESATQYAATASVVGADASTALDATLSIATQLVPGTTSKLPAGRPRGLASNLGCPGGGTATMTIAGASAQEESNGQFEANEAYQIAFIDCRAAGGAATLNGAVTLSVLDATRSATAVALSTTTLKAGLPRGVVSLIGSAELQRTVVTGGRGSQATTRVTASSLDITTGVHGGSGSFTLSRVDLTRQTSTTTGAPQSVSFGGTLALAGEVAGHSVDYNVATQPGATFDANGLPIQGRWVITLAHHVVKLAVADGNVTIDIDAGNGPAVGSSFSQPLLAFVADAS